jgi:hypothetical protein
MTPQEKARELFNQYLKILGGINSADWVYFHGNEAKQCALIAVDEILNNNCGSHTDESNAMNEEIYCDEYYWQEVKQEIEQL